MDRIINSKVDKQSIYEIYRACRLCGAGAGYKMPIIQNVVDVDDEVELKQKIRECVQIEVHQDDKMPPLICELCVDKVNDFYEFLDMCRQTNKRTRLRLGLPPQTMPRGAPDAGDCILGVTEPVYVNDDEDDDAPLSRGSPRNVKQKNSNAKKPPELRVKVEKNVSCVGRSWRGSPSLRHTRHDRHSSDHMSVGAHKKQDKKTKVMPPAPKSILKKGKDIKIEETSPTLRSKRTREPPKPEIPQKKVKLAVKPPPKPAPKHSPRLQPRPARSLRRSSPPPPRRPSPPPPPRRASPPPAFLCVVCKQRNKTAQANYSHMRVHAVTYTNSRLACNACGEWFSSSEETSAHHKRHNGRHKPYECRGCGGRYTTYSSYQLHTEGDKCVPWEEVPDIKCTECWRLYPTQNLLDQHKCQGEDGRPGGKCSKCNRAYALQKNLKKHESTCTAKKKGSFVLPAALSEKLRPLQVRVARCDPLLAVPVAGHYDVSALTQKFGLDSNCIYPYINSESLKFDRMVNIKSELDDFFIEEDYIHWDSDVSTDDDVTEVVERQVHKLSTLTLKTIFSRKCIGRVPRKRRKVKTEKNVFDSLMNNDFGDDMTTNINNIIDNLDDENLDKRDDSIEKKLESVDKNDSSDKINDDSVKKNDDSVLNEDAIDVPSENVDKDSESKEDEKSLDVSLEEKHNDTEDQDGRLSNEVSDNISNEIEMTENIKHIDEEKPENSRIDEENKDCKNKVTAENANNVSLEDSKTEENDISKIIETKCLVNENNDESDKSKTNEILSEDISAKETDGGLTNSDKNNDIENNLHGKNNDESTETTKELSKTEQVNDETLDCNKDSFDTENIVGKDSVSISEEQSVKETDDTEESNVQDRLSSDICNDVKNSLDDKISAINDNETLNNDLVNSHKENTEDNASRNSNDDNENTDNDKINGDVEEKSDKLNMEDFHDTCDDEIDDKKLMEDLNEHIGEPNSEKENKDNDKCKDGNENNDVKEKNDDKDKITLDDLMPKDHDTKSMDLDSISDDDFNFDA